MDSKFDENLTNKIKYAQSIADRFSLDKNMCQNALQFLEKLNNNDMLTILSSLKMDMKAHTIHERSLMLGNLDEIKVLYDLNNKIIANLSLCTLNSDGIKLKEVLEAQQEIILYIINNEKNNSDYNDTLKLEVTSNYYHYMLYLFYLVLIILALVYCLMYTEKIFFVDMLIFIVCAIIFLHYMISYINNHIKIKVSY